VPSPLRENRFYLRARWMLKEVDLLHLFKAMDEFRIVEFAGVCQQVLIVGVAQALKRDLKLLRRQAHQRFDAE
jgi:hypothetical protein